MEEIFSLHFIFKSDNIESLIFFLKTFQKDIHFNVEQSSEKTKFP